MKPLFFILLFLMSLTLNAQTLDLSGVNLVDDSTTVSVQKDTAYFYVETGVKEREGKEPVTLYRVSLITVTGGKAFVNHTSGIVTRKEMRDWLKLQRDSWIENNIINTKRELEANQKLKAQANSILNLGPQ